MGRYSSTDFARAAGRLPSSMAAAIRRDLGISGATYLADAAAESHAVIVLHGLAARGVTVLGSHMSGTRLTVNVNARDAAAVTAAGASVALGTPAKFVSPVPYFTPAADDTVFGGEGYLWGNSKGAFQCSVGFPGYRTSDDVQQFLTAGHCLVGTTTNTAIHTITDGSPGEVTDEKQVGPTVGAPAKGKSKLGKGYDAGLVNVFSDIPQLNGVSTWGGGTGAASAGTPVVITGKAEALVGANLCKSGSRTGWSCGVVTHVNVTVRVSDGGTKSINSIITGGDSANTAACVLPGDSGGAADIGTNAVGLNDTSSSGTSCDGSRYESSFFPLVAPSSKGSVSKLFGTGWEPMVSLSAPAIATPAGTSVLTSSGITGTVAAPSSGETVSLFLDGATKAFESASASSGTWTLSAKKIPRGAHDFTVESFLGPWSKSASTSSSVTVEGVITLSRPTITGTAKVGSKLTASQGKAAQSGVAFSYQWMSGTTEVGTGARTYVAQPGDAGAKITVVVTATKSGYNTSRSTSKSTKAVAG